jgi:hypothetical protein
VKIDAAGTVIVRVPNEQATVPSDDAWVQITASFPDDERAAQAWAANILKWLSEGGSLNPDNALNLYGRVYD